jgi:2-isopropylmalate synthase
LADLKKDIFDEDIVALVDDELVRAHDRIKLISLDIACGTHTPHARLSLSIDGEVKTCDGSGDGPVDAAFHCIKQLFQTKARLQLYQVHAVTGGTDAQAEVTVRLEENGRTVNGQGADTDTMVASVKAYLHALNKLLVKREKTAPSALSA